MIHRKLTASYECGCRLTAAGCPLVIRKVGMTDYLIGLRIGTDLGAGVIISSWDLVLPSDLLTYRLGKMPQKSREP